MRVTEYEAAPTPYFWIPVIELQNTATVLTMEGGGGGGEEEEEEEEEE